MSLMIGPGLRDSVIRPGPTPVSVRMPRTPHHQAPRRSTSEQRLVHGGRQRFLASAGLPRWGVADLPDEVRLGDPAREHRLDLRLGGM